MYDSSELVENRRVGGADPSSVRGIGRGAKPLRPQAGRHGPGNCSPGNSGACRTRQQSVRPGDTGTNDSLIQASSFVQAVEERQGQMIGCPEEISYRMGYITAADLERLGQSMKGSDYGQYLLRLLADEA